MQFFVNTAMIVDKYSIPYLSLHTDRNNSYNVVKLNSKINLEAKMCKARHRLAQLTATIELPKQNMFIDIAVMVIYSNSCIAQLFLFLIIWTLCFPPLSMTIILKRL